MAFLDLDSDVARAGPEGKNAHALMMREVNGPEYAHNKGPKPQMKKGRPAMLPEARKILVDLYRPYNERLVELLGDPKISAGWAA